MSSLAERIEELTAGMSRGWQVKLAAACNIKPPSVSDWVTGKTLTIDGQNLLAAAAFFRVEPKWLQSGKGRKWSAENGSAGAAEIARTTVADTLTIAETLERLGDLLMRANPKTRAAVADLLARYAQDPSSGRSIAKAIEMLVQADQA